MSLASFLWTKHGEAPIEYKILVMCRDIFHCTPSQLLGEDTEMLFVLFDLAQEEARVLKADQEAKKFTGSGVFGEKDKGKDADTSSAE